MKLSRVDVSAYSNNAIRKEDGRFYMAHEVEAEIDALKARIERMEGQRKIEEAANDAAIEQIKRLKAENERLPEIEALYEYLKSCIQGVHIEPGARGTGIYTWALQICEPINVQTEGELTGHEIDAALREIYGTTSETQ